MKINTTGYAIAMRPRFVAPTLGAAGEKSARCPRAGRRSDHGDAGMVTGHRPWSPLIT